MPMPMYGGGGRPRTKWGLIIALFLLICVPLIIYLSLWGTNTLCDTSNPDKQSWIGVDCQSVYEGSSTPAPSPSSTPLQTLLKSAQAIQVSEKDISAGNVAPTNRNPTLPTVPTYTLSMDVFIEKGATSSRNLIENTDVAPDWLGNPATGANAGIIRRPMIYVAPSGVSWTGQNHICAEHFTTNNGQAGICTTEPAPLGAYFNLVMIADNSSKKLAVYINGANKGEAAASGNFSWSATNNWILGNPGYGHKTSDGALKVKNVYLFPKILTAAEIALVAGKSVPVDPIDLQTSELILTPSNPDIPAKTQPMVSPTSNVAFTMSMDIDIVATAPDNRWREIFQNTVNDSWDGGAGKAVTTGNTPLFSIVPPGVSEPANKVLFRMLLDNDDRFEAFTKILVPGTYTKLTVVCTETTIKIYTNGVKDADVTTPTGRKMKWRPVNNFTWNPTSQYWLTGQTAKVKNAQWWHRALTDAEVTALGTSTYMPQPLSLGTSAYVRETYMPY